MSDDIRRLLDAASSARLRTGPPHEAVRQRVRRNRRRRAAGWAGGGLAVAALSLGSLAWWGTPGTTDLADGRVGLDNVGVSVPEGWAAETRDAECAATARGVVVLKAAGALDACLGIDTTAGAARAGDTFEPKIELSASNTPSAYVAGDLSLTSNLVWTGDSVEYGQVQPVNGGVVLIRAARSAEGGTVVVLARDEQSATRVLADLSPKFATASRNHTVASPPSVERARISLPVDPSEATFDGAVDSAVWAQTARLLRPLPARPESAAACLVSGQGATTTGTIPGTTVLRARLADDAGTYDVHIGPSSCPVVIDSWGGVAERPAGLVPGIAEIVLEDDPTTLASFRAGWGRNGP